MGYIDFVAIPCTYCETIGKIWKNPNKKGSGKDAINAEEMDLLQEKNYKDNNFLHKVNIQV